MKNNACVRTRKLRHLTMIQLLLGKLTFGNFLYLLPSLIEPNMTKLSQPISPLTPQPQANLSATIKLTHPYSPFPTSANVSQPPQPSSILTRPHHAYPTSSKISQPLSTSLNLSQPLSNSLNLSQSLSTSPNLTKLHPKFSQHHHLFILP